MLTAIIATLNRAGALREISLPSLLNQDTTSFEVIVWDASPNDDTKNVVIARQQGFENKGIRLLYRNAPRKGLASQRNDSINEATGDIVLFIDDDSELSRDGISSLIAMFDNFVWLKGAALPLFNRTSSVLAGRKRTALRAIAGSILHFFQGNDRSFRTVRDSTFNILPSRDLPGYAEWLTGACMAYRKEVFDYLRFDERLQYFGGYALGEDLDLSHRVFLRYDLPLLVSPSGMFVHHNVPGGRLDGRKMAASIFYNSKIIRDNFNEYAKYGILPFLLGQRVCRIIGLLLMGYSIGDIAKGFRDYRVAIKSK
jgi:glycosyltransferase involved in cell wall biosynthesis